MQPYGITRYGEYNIKYKIKRIRRDNERCDYGLI